MKELIELAAAELIVFANGKDDTVHFGVENDGEVIGKVEDNFRLTNIVCTLMSV